MRGNGKLFLWIIRLKNSTQQSVGESPEVVIIEGVGWEKATGYHFNALVQLQYFEIAGY